MRPAVPLCTALLLSLAASGCSLLPNGGGAGGSGSGAADGDSLPEGALVRKGVVGEGPDAMMHARWEIESLERWDDRSVLRFTVTNTEDAPVELKHNVFSPNRGMSGATRTFRLLDPVGQEWWQPQGPSEIHTFGTQLGEMAWEPGVAYEFALVYDPLPEHVETLTVLGAAGFGPVTGVPVTEGEPEPLPTEEPEWLESEQPPPNDRAVLPMRDIEDGDEFFVENPQAVHGSRIEAVGQSTEGDRTTVSLQADVLFDFDSDALDDTAEKVLEDAIARTREEADPERPPVTVTGHTDGIGTSDYNQDLSERRAEAVEGALAEGLGGGYGIAAEGKADTEPVREEGGDDDEDARAQNRRVEISYAFRDSADPSADAEAAEEEEPGAPFQVPPEEAGAPGAARPQSGSEAAGSATEAETGDELTVYPFYRDGAFLVGRFSIAAREEVPGTGTLYADRFGRFTDFTVVDPGSGTSYRQAQLGSDDTPIGLVYVGTEPWPADRSADAANEAFAYFAAPPDGVESVTFNAGPFGKIADVPIE